MKKGEWANIMMMPSIATLIDYSTLTKHFRNTVVQVVYDALRNKIKPVAIRAAKKQIRKETDHSPDEDSDPEPEPPILISEEREVSPPKVSHYPPQMTMAEAPTSHPLGTINHLQGLQLLNLAVPEQGPNEDRMRYLKRVWVKVKNNHVCREAAKRLWLGKVTGEDVNESEIPPGPL